MCFHRSISPQLPQSNNILQGRICNCSVVAVHKTKRDVLYEGTAID